MSAQDAQSRGEAAFSQSKGSTQVHDGIEQLQHGTNSLTGSTNTAGADGASGLSRDQATGEVTGQGHGYSSSTAAGTGTGAGQGIGTGTGIPTTGANPAAGNSQSTGTDASAGAVPGGTTGTSSSARGAGAGSLSSAGGTADTTASSAQPPEGSRGYGDNVPQTAKEAPLIGSIAGDNVSFKEQVQGHAKYFAGKIFGNDKEVQEGSARVAGVETADPSSDRAQQAASQTSK